MMILLIAGFAYLAKDEIKGFVDHLGKVDNNVQQKNAKDELKRY